ncbi:FecCD family ABC transporter permease [Haloarcula salinisoli]|uniref:Iron ABC transporter permease n=1 Tax=Haloarcula salinisoli TaxID=2487746 RepID=A0A8J7YD02_9EURY|nr:iron ABC transporter permease [Halomicroarcula salinisoli]MBX0303142.1 iron ABC transporter permease [Halomicroarcula salinisoli]
MASETEQTGLGRLSDGGDWIDASLVSLIVASVAVTVLAGLVQVSYGTLEMTFVETWRAVFNPAVIFDLTAWRALLLGGEFPDVRTQSVVVWLLRLPRVFTGIFVGVNLAIAGAIFQAVTRNELASSQTLGVNAGAGLAVLLTLVVYTELAYLLPLVAALGGAVAFGIVYAISWNGGTSPVRLILAGIIVATVFNSLQTALFFFASDLAVVQSALQWTTGSLIGVDWEQVRIILPWTVVLVPVALVGGRHLNVLVLGEKTAQSLGMNVERMRFGLSGIAILAASSAIAVAGVVGFVGLIVPHLVRTIVGSDYRRVLLGSVFVGPALMTVADMGARLGPAVLGFGIGVAAVVLGLTVLGGGRAGWHRVEVTVGDSYRRFGTSSVVVGGVALALVFATGGLTIADTQLPVGVVTGLIGGPYFLYLMRRRENMGDI